MNKISCSKFAKYSISNSKLKYLNTQILKKLETQTQNSKNWKLKLKTQKNWKLKPKLKPMSIFECICLDI